MSDIIIRMYTRKVGCKVDPHAAVPSRHKEYGLNHLNTMCQKIIIGEVAGEKAHRWLGWIQCAVCIGGGATLEKLKEINRKA